eukprot:scaffold672_cov124-Skeletonema_menzelii.AAC.4
MSTSAPLSRDKLLRKEPHENGRSSIASQHSTTTAHNKNCHHLPLNLTPSLFQKRHNDLNPLELLEILCTTNRMVNN